MFVENANAQKNACTIRIDDCFAIMRRWRHGRNG